MISGGDFDDDDSDSDEDDGMNCFFLELQSIKIFKSTLLHEITKLVINANRKISR